ncbi:phosphatidylinositol N-acetylglucosaminyltransferase subunit H-like [Daktulosphaira vitifoliae]|uniref:phosphatidylinositol N-acetylglucosaminyltransferase subunit H-like n=1 Tax=Daktulosphaira vitifoliae TaxID=58002 RepID=UPI0021AAE9FB|nr:phosphatidylinositol N-acetylglucosaminyltransferase subunit H-like [Daktulosphaira vitifoliae]
MRIIKMDHQHILKSSIHESLKVSCVEYSVEKLKKIVNTDLFALFTTLTLTVYSIIINKTLISISFILYSSVLLLQLVRICCMIHSESLLITAPIGLQLTTTYVTGRQMVLSLPWNCIKDILIVDLIHRQQVLFYLAVQTSQNGLIILFQKSKPRLHILEIIYRDTHKLIENNRKKL